MMEVLDKATGSTRIFIKRAALENPVRVSALSRLSHAFSDRLNRLNQQNTKLLETQLFTAACRAFGTANRTQHGAFCRARIQTNRLRYLRHLVHAEQVPRQLRQRKRRHFCPLSPVMVMDGDQPGLGEFGAALWWTDNKDMKCTRATRVSFCSLSLSSHPVCARAGSHSATMIQRMETD